MEALVELSLPTSRPRRLPSIDALRHSGIRRVAGSDAAPQFRSSRLAAVASESTSITSGIVQEPASRTRSASAPAPVVLPVKSMSEGAQRRRPKRRQSTSPADSTAPLDFREGPTLRTVQSEPAVVMPDTLSETSRKIAARELQLREANLSRLQFYRRATARLKSSGVVRPPLGNKRTERRPEPAAAEPGLGTESVAVTQPAQPQERDEADDEAVAMQQPAQPQERDEADDEALAMQQSLSALLSSPEFTLTAAECAAVYDRLSGAETELVMRSLQKIVLDRYGDRAADIDNDVNLAALNEVEGPLLTLSEIQRLLLDRLRSVSTPTPANPVL
eukprot:TRINITY_DN1990_c0_g1_i1.p1 TRINITY_DN1990_c0_g1~~TRINITY_DN1990_c0_g1_i1.p1  ORF type:complete len:333 (-),score=81.46 TRINITY_DN1990_c0_g1_i1:235-1233(-)